MGILRDTGHTSLNLPSLGQPGAPRDALLEAVREAAAAEFEVYGEIGRGADGARAYLARDLADAKLVALKLAPAPASGEFLLDVVKQLDASVPANETRCPRCSAPLRQWARFCTKCGTDLWTDPSVGQGWSGAELLAAVKEATQGRFEVLGEMRSAQGGGFVYFAKELATGNLVALRLQQEMGEEYSIGMTGVLRPIADSVLDQRGTPTLVIPAPRLPAGGGPPRSPRPVVTAPPAPARTLGLPTSGPVAPARRADAVPVRQPPVRDEPWASVREFFEHPIVLPVAVALAAFLLIIILLIVLVD